MIVRALLKRGQALRRARQGARVLALQREAVEQVMARKRTEGFAGHRRVLAPH